jgi:predicted DNA-binding transcriptional regulator YafY
MARKQPGRPEAEGPAPERAAVTEERFVRLRRLIGLLAEGPKSRLALARQLGIDVRGFYRDLELLRAVGVPVTLTEGRYGLEGDVDAALARLPFPDPRLTLGEAQQLARGRAAAHRRLREEIARLMT